MNDSTLLNRVSSGDRQAFNLLAERYYDSLFAFAFRILKDHAVTEDVIQDSLIKIWLNRKKISQKAYLYTIVKNQSLSYLRNAMRRGTLPENEEPVAEDISTYYIEQEVYRTLTTAIDQLPPRTAEAIRLSLEGLKQEEIAEQMGITLPTVKFLKAEGIKKLRGMLDPTAFTLLLVCFDTGE